MTTGFLFLSGLGLSKKAVSLDTEGYRVYQNRKASSVINGIKHGGKDDWKAYDDEYFALLGYAQNVKPKNDQFDLSISAMEDSSHINCKVKDDVLANAIVELSAGDTILVYGQLSVTALNKNNPTLYVDSFQKVDSDRIDEDAVSTRNGNNTYKTGDLLERDLHNGKVKYYIPQSWEQVEHNIVAEELGEIEGYQYRLNELNRGAVYAQSLFVCYFEIERFVALNDRSDMTLIEEAILRDITGKENLKDFPLRTVKTYYGTEYKYYQDGYKKAMTGDPYRMEFVFQEIGSEGILVYLYVYNNDTEDQGKIKEEALMVMRLLETQ